MIHIYRSKLQRATDFTDTNFDPPHKMAFSPGTLLWTDCCEQRRRAKYCHIAVYYDGDRVYCSPNKGCKSKAFIEANRRRAFRNRSRGQKRRRDEEEK